MLCLMKERSGFGVKVMVGNKFQQLLMEKTKKKHNNHNIGKIQQQLNLRILKI